MHVGRQRARTVPPITPELHSTDPERPLAYPVRDGVPVLLESEARPLA